MDKITTAIVTAIRSGICQETETGAGKAYQALEARILEQFGEDGELYCMVRL